MVTSKEIINWIKGLSLADRLKIVEEILRGIREESTASAKEGKDRVAEGSEPPILSMAGILNEEEANLFDSAIEESRKIDADEW